MWTIFVAWPISSMMRSVQRPCGEKTTSIFGMVLGFSAVAIAAYVYVANLNAPPRPPAPQAQQSAQTAAEDPLLEGDSFIARLGRKLVVTALVVYKGGISPLLPSFCKFYPTCSVYAMEAVERHGVRRGLWLAAKRVLRCRPFAPGGHDAVPDA